MIKWLHRLTTLFLFILVSGFFICESTMNGPKESSLAWKRQISENTTLYVTKYNGGATVTDIYRYYLGDERQTLKQLNKRAPFLVSDNDAATVIASGNSINITLTGRVYSFTNSTLFFSQGVAVMPVINLKATGVR